MLRMLPLILRNVLRNRRRTLLTLASSAISLALLALIIAMAQGFFYGDDVSPAGAHRVVTRHRVSLTQPLPASLKPRIAAIPGIEYVSAYSWFQGKYKDEKPENFFARFAVDPDVFFDIFPDFVMPADQLAAFQHSRTACVVGEKIAQKQHLKVGDTLQIVGDIYPVTLELTIVGIYQHPANTESLLFHRDYLRELLPASAPNRDMVGTYIFRVTNPQDVPRISGAIDSMNENSPYPTRTESEKEFGRSFLAFLGNIKLFLAAICAAVTFTILLVSANTIAMAVRERTRETAILRTLGYNPGEILSLVLGESILISLLGGIAGLGIGILLGKGLADFGFQGIKWEAGAMVLAMAVLIGLAAAFFPAYFASRKNIVESLRFTG